MPIFQKYAKQKAVQSVAKKKKIRMLDKDKAGVKAATASNHRKWQSKKYGARGINLAYDHIFKPCDIFLRLIVESNVIPNIKIKKYVYYLLNSVIFIVSKIFKMISVALLFVHTALYKILYCKLNIIHFGGRHTLTSNNYGNLNMFPLLPNLVKPFVYAA